MKAKNSTAIMNIASSMIAQGISFVSLPLFTRLLGTGQYGRYSVYMSWLGVLSCIMGLCVKNAIPTGIEDFRDDYPRFRRTIFAAGFGISALLIALAAILAKPLAAFTGFRPAIVIILFANSFCFSVIDFFHTRNIYEKKPLANLITNSTIAVCHTLLSILFILRLSSAEKYEGKILGYALTYFAAAAAASAIILSGKDGKGARTPGKSLTRKYTGYAFAIGTPMIFHMLSQNILTQSDRVMMQKLGTPDGQIGIYSFFYTFANVLYVIFLALNNSFTPFYYDELRNEKSPAENRSRLLSNYIEIYTVLTTGFILLSREVSRLLAGDEYMDGLSVLPILAAAMYFIFLSQLPINYEVYLKKTKLIAACTTGCALLNIVLNAILIPKGGMLGAATATAVSYAALFIVHTALSRKYSFRLPKAVVTSVTAVAAASAVYYLAAELPILRWGLGAVIGIAELIRIKKRGTVF